MQTKIIRSVAGEALGYVCNDVFKGYAAWVPLPDGGWFKVAEEKQNPTQARRAIRNWHDLRPDQQRQFTDKR